MNNFLDINFFGNQQMALFSIAGTFIGIMLLSGALVYCGLYIWNDIAEKRREI